MGLQFTPKQTAGWELLTDAAKTRILFDGGARSGKTCLVIEYMVMRALRFAGSRQLIARTHRVHAYGSIWNDSLRGYLTKFIPRAAYELSESPMLVCKFQNGSEIIVEGLDDKDRVDKILGTEYFTIFLNEARQLSWPTTQMAITRLAQKCRDAQGRLGANKLLIDTNPSGPRHWLHRVGVEGIYPDTLEPLADLASWARLHWSAYDNVENLPPDYLHALEALPSVQRDRMLNGLWVQAEGLVYPMFDSCLADKPDAMPEGTEYGSIDWGFSAPFCAINATLDHDDVLWVHGLRYKRRVPLSVHANAIKRDVMYFADPAGKDQIIEFRRADHAVRKAPNDIMAGIASVTARMTTGRLKIIKTPAMQPLLEEAAGYVYEEDTESEKPRDENNHAMDALRYLVAGVDRGRAAIAEPDGQAEPGTPAEQPQVRYGDAKDPQPRPRDERLPEGDPHSDTDEPWMSPMNEAIWNDV